MNGSHKGTPRMRNGGSSQTCNRPGRGASKNDLSELHDEKMRNKRARYHSPRYQTHRHRSSGNVGHQNWPDGKFAGPHNDCATSKKYRKVAVA